MRQPVGEQRRVDVLLDVARQQEPVGRRPSPSSTTDTLLIPVPPSGGSRRHLAADRPQDAQPDLVDREPVAGGERQAHGRARPRRAAAARPRSRARAAHPRLEDARDAVALEQQGEPGDVVLVRVGQDRRRRSADPTAGSAVERDEQPVGIRSAVDEQPPAARALDEDRVALPDVEDA